jgi:hypothetical protein
VTVAAGPASAERERDFRRLWLAQGVSTFGSLITHAALPFTAVLLLHAGAAQMALLAAAYLVAGVVVAPLAGPWLDRRSRKPVMLACDLARALLLLTLPLAALAGRLGFGLLLAVQVLEGALTTVFDVAQRSWLPELVGEAGLVRANARLASTNSVAEMGSFGIAGWLVQWLGGPLTMAIDALSYVGSACALADIRAREPLAVPAGVKDGPPARGFAAWTADARDGLRVAFADPALRALALVEGVLFTAFGMVMTCYTLYTARELALPTGPLGMVYGLGGLGSLAAALAAPRLGARLGVRACLYLGLSLGALGLVMAVLATRGKPALALALLAAQQLVGDSGWALFLVHADSLRMRLAPAGARARVAAGASALTVLARLAGAAFAAAIAARFGPRGALALGAGVVALAVPLCLAPALARGISRASSTT